jgi:hypothetical protein
MCGIEMSGYVIARQLSTVNVRSNLEQGLSMLHRLPGVPALRGVPGVFLGVGGTPVNFLSATPFVDSPSLWISITARLAESPICAGGRSTSILDKARKTSCGSTAGCRDRSRGMCGGSVDKLCPDLDDRIFDDANERFKDENRRFRSSSIALVVWMAECA